MLATQRMSPPNSLFAGNQAGAPLPLIPRRLSRESSSSVPIKVVVQQSSPPLPLDDSGSSSSSDSGRPTVSIRSKRACSENPPHTQTVPLRSPLLYSPGVSLRPTTARNFSESHAQSFSASSSSGSGSIEPPSPSCTLSASQSQPRLIRKKSGQLVKSSLKPSKSLSLLTPCSPYSNSKSAPATPIHTPKNVHFDAQLEHVKLFLAEQKPLAVSRDGSPTDDTSGTDTDFPDWVFGSNSSSSSTRNLTMHHVNLPPRVSASNNDVLLESLELSPDSPSVVGRVRVANLAYAKSVVARFTFDAWQTTSEVSARYVSSPSLRTDIFVFSVRLNDLMARIDGKRMCLAVRYSVGGREIWDNNGGLDYLVEFGFEAKPKSKDSERELALEREREREREREDRIRRPTPDPKTIASLRSTLEKVVAPSPVPRYDFSQSLSNRWVPPPLPHTPVPRTSSTSAHAHAHVRTQSHPSPGSTPRPVHANPSSIPWPRGGKERERERWTPPLGSPRDVSDEDRPPFAGVTYAGRVSDREDSSFPVNTRTHTHTHTPTPGRHHRRGYFAEVHHSSISASASGKGNGVRRTPPGTPPVGPASESDEDEFASGEDEDEGEEEGEKTPMPGRCYSFPPTSTRTGTTSGTGTPGLGFFGGSGAGARGGHGHVGTGAGIGVALGEGVGVGMRMSLGMGVGMRVGEDSELSTPSFGSSRATSPSPSPSPTESEVTTETEDTETETEGEGDDGKISASDSSGSYKEFLSRFCFFTGTGTATGVGLFPDSPHSPPRALSPHSSHSHSSHIRAHTHPHLQKRFIVPRTQSASEIIESPRFLQERAMAVRSPSFDDVLLGSGAATPVSGMSPPPIV